MDIFEIRRENLRALMNTRFGGKQVALADAIERSPNYISRCLSTSKTAGSSKNMGEELARYIETKLGLAQYQMDRPGAFLKVGGETSSIDGPTIESNAEMIGMLSGWDSSTPLHDDEVAIPLYKEVEMAAGHGATEVVEVPGRLLRFAKSTLREAGVLESNAACATVSGRSMERLIMDGATIGIDRGTTNIIDGEIYAFDHDGMLRVKYLYRLPGGGLRIRSENHEEYPDEIVQPEQLSHIRILGWVFWWSTIRRRNGLKLAR